MGSIFLANRTADGGPTRHRQRRRSGRRRSWRRRTLRRSCARSAAGSWYVTWGAFCWARPSSSAVATPGRCAHWSRVSTSFHGRERSPSLTLALSLSLSPSLTLALPHSRSLSSTLARPLTLLYSLSLSPSAPFPIPPRSAPRHRTPLKPLTPPAMAEPLIGKTTLPRLWMYICQLWIIVAVGAIAMVSPGERPSASEVARRPRRAPARSSASEAFCFCVNPSTRRCSENPPWIDISLRGPC